MAIRQIANVPAPGQFSTIDGNNNDEDDDVFEGGEAIERAVLVRLEIRECDVISFR